MAFKLEAHKEITQIHTYQDPSLGIMKWGTTNCFPQTLANIIEQSPTAKPAVKRTSLFYKGAKFEGEDIIVSPYGLTLKKVVSIMADDYAMFEAFALQCNFNIKGEVVGINPLRITDLRFNEFDELNFSSKIGYHPNFGRNSIVTKTIDSNVTKGNIKWIDRFNPDAVLSQIDKTKGGISNFNGQILYHTETGHSSYPIPPLQACINFVLSDVENSILVRKETCTGFINSYLLKTTMSSEDPALIALQCALEEAQGARGNGKIIAMTGLAPDDLTATVLEEIGSGASGSKTIIDSATNANELIEKKIHGAYLIPPILAGADVNTGFSTTELEDAYFVFNTQTKNGREAIESGINRILKNSVFPVKKIHLEKLRLDRKDEGENNDNKIKVGF